jgi:hypothetical protein
MTKSTRFRHSRPPIRGIWLVRCVYHVVRSIFVALEEWGWHVRGTHIPLKCGAVACAADSTLRVHLNVSVCTLH